MLILLKYVSVMNCYIVWENFVGEKNGKYMATLLRILFPVFYDIFKNIFYIYSILNFLMLSEIQSKIITSLFTFNVAFFSVNLVFDKLISRRMILFTYFPVMFTRI